MFTVYITYTAVDVKEGIYITIIFGIWWIDLRYIVSYLKRLKITAKMSHNHPISKLQFF